MERHKGDNCPNAVQQYDNKNINTNIQNTNTNKRGTGRGRGAFRGKGKNFRETKPYYEKPNWLVNFEVQENDTEENKYENYQIKAQVVTIEDLLTQSQTEIQNSDIIPLIPSEIGREKEQDTSTETEPASSTSEVNLNRNILDLNNTISETGIQKLNGDFIKRSEKST